MEVKTKLEESYPKLIARRGFETLRRGPSPSELSVIPRGRVASSKKFTALLLRAAMFPNKKVRQSGKILT